MLTPLRLLPALALAAGLSSAAESRAHPREAGPTPWTVLIYAAVDNDWEQPFMRDVRRMRRGLTGSTGLEVLLLIDRAPGYSRDKRALGEDFEDTRLYRLTGGVAERLEGGPQLPGLTLNSTSELNTGAASTVRDFVRFGKQHYPAQRYALWFVSHGEGPHSCPDETDEDLLHTAELTDVLEEQDSVHLLGFDACLMGGVENAYQWRPEPGKFGADFLLAAAPVSSSWPYEQIFAGWGPEPAADADIEPGDASTLELDAKLSTSALAAHVVEELRAQISEGRSGDRGLERDLQSWGSFDLGAVSNAKQHLDALAARLYLDGAKAELMKLRGSGLEAGTFVYVWPERNSELHMPHVDIVHLAERVAADPSFSEQARELAARAARAADQVVHSSMGMDHYGGFVAGRHGLYLVFPEGDRRTRRGASYWQRTDWYTPLPVEGGKDAYGRYSWCMDGATAGNEVVENWFELMDAWFDEPSVEEPGGANGYVW